MFGRNQFLLEINSETGSLGYSSKTRAEPLAVMSAELIEKLQPIGKESAGALLSWTSFARHYFLSVLI